MVSMATVWDRATEFLSDNLSAVLPVSLLSIFVPYSIFGNLIPLLSQSNDMGRATLSAILLALAVLVFWGGLAITALAIDPAGGRAAATRMAARRLVPTLAVWLIFAIGLTLLATPIFIGMGLAGRGYLGQLVGGRPDATGGAAMAFSILYALAFVVVAMWLVARLVLLNPVIVMERRGIGLFARSFKLTRGITWKIIGVLILYVIVSQVSELATKFVFGAVFGLIAGGEPGRSPWCSHRSWSRRFPRPLPCWRRHSPPNCIWPFATRARRSSNRHDNRSDGRPA